MFIFFNVCLVIASPIQTQSTAVTLQPAVGQVVIVDAVVTDRKGRPAKGLVREDFELYEDGRPVEVALFQAPSAADALESGAFRSGTGPSPDGVRKSREALSVVIYVDRWMLSGAGRRRALDQAAEIAENHLARGARVMVIGDDKGLRPLTPLTDDGAQVRAAIARIQTWATESPAALETSHALGDIEATIHVAEDSRACEGTPPCLCVLPDLVDLVRHYAVTRSAEAQGAADRLSMVTSALGSLSGRKLLVYVSEGLEQRPGVQLFDQLTTICPEALHADASSILAPMQEFDTSSPLRDAISRANAARVTIYPIDARGLSGLSGADVSVSNRRYAPSASNDRLKDANLEGQYRLLADGTGGFAMLRGLDPKAAMTRFDSDDQGRYLLGFYPGDPDGKTHSLTLGFGEKVRAKKDLIVRYRQSYLRATVPERRGRRSLSALLFGIEEDGLHLKATVDRTGPAGAVVRIALPLSSLAAIEGTPSEARVQIVLSFRRAGSDSKAAVTVREKETTFRLDPEERQRAGGVREIVVELPIGPDAYELAIGVEDVSSGVASYLLRTVAAVQGFIDS